MLVKKYVACFLVLAGILTISTVASTNQASKSKNAAPSAPASGPNSPTPSTPQPFVVRVEAGGPVHVASDNPPSSSIWPPIIGPVAGALLALFGAWIGLKISKQNATQAIQGALTANQATLWQKANELELRSIQERLDKFYGPLMTRLQADHMLAQDIRSRQPKDYRLLRSLLNPNWLPSLSKGEQKLVALICEHAEKLEEMIINAGSVDPVLIPYFSRAIAHFRILRLAYEGVLENDPVRFALYVYPKQLDHVLILEIKRLRARVDALRKQPDAPIGPIPSLVIRNDKKYVLDEWPDPDGRILDILGDLQDVQLGSRSSII